MKKILSILFIIFALISPISPVFDTPTVHAATDIVNDGGLSSGLVSCWELDEESGTRVDSAASGNDLSDNASVLYGTGKQGNAADFETANDEFLSVTTASSTGLDLTGDFTLATWVNFESVSATMRLMGKTDLNAGVSGRSYGFSWNSVLGMRLELSIGSTADNPAVAWSPSTATWYHLVVTRDQADGDVYFYLNGSEHGSDLIVNTGALNDITVPFQVGSHYNAVAGSANEMDGLMDVAAVWSRPLSASEVGELYASGSGIPCDAGGGGGGGAVDKGTIILFQ